MKKYTVNFCQEYAQNIGVTIQVETSLSFEELENEISEISSKWTRLGRLSEKELISSGEIVGYVKGLIQHGMEIPNLLVKYQLV